MAQGGYIDVKCRVNGVLDNLKDCFGELHEIERIMTDARDGSFEVESDLLSTVREMLGALETGFKKVPKNEKSKEESLRSKRMRFGRSADRGICTHKCVYHPEILNPGLWSKLPENLVAEVFARLPIPRIMELRNSSEAWAALSDSASFRGAFAEANPKLVGHLGYDGDLFRLMISDAAFEEWHGIELNLPRGFCTYMENLHACDGGLVCFVLLWEGDAIDRVIVCNPLTTEWRKLPDIPFEFSDPVMVQLVTNELFYRVILVYSEGEETLGAFEYDSRTESWSVMSSVLVYGTGNALMSEKHDPFVFDCATKQLITLGDCAALEDLEGLRRYSILKDRLFVLHELINQDSPGDVTERFVISEFTWKSSRSDLRKLNDYQVPSRGPAGTDDVEIFTSTGFILVTWVNETQDDSHHLDDYNHHSDYDSDYEERSIRQLIRIYDVSAGRWRDLPPLIRVHQNLEGTFMCELRWDAEP